MITDSIVAFTDRTCGNAQNPPKKLTNKMLILMIFVEIMI
ncbi:hypothetical protein CPS_0696 [Colwellia psychrerythraea 34H]|uniref:Uncharacterized protein n=1 Tax=Colwellia psychrerythraea (strain 34H / ATCC BAA-681) TaxID=167879 RepID=Q488R8_COLP3|nr:hypothetical protein CPS_0696 [Colwellia psychrerythraea 34H]